MRHAVALALPRRLSFCCSRLTIVAFATSRYGISRAASARSRVSATAACRLAELFDRLFAVSSIASVPRTPVMRIAAATITSTIVNPACVFIRAIGSGGRDHPEDFVQRGQSGADVVEAMLGHRLHALGDRDVGDRLGGAARRS